MNTEIESRQILTSGYLRQEIERVCKLSIPSEIKQLCFDYWLITFCDEWDTKSSKCIRLEFNEQSVKCFAAKAHVFGCHSVSSGQFTWRLNLKKIGVDGVGIGVIDSEKATVNLEGENFFTEDIGASWFSVEGALYNHINKTGKKFRPKMPNIMLNTRLDIKIDFDEGNLYYSIKEDKFIKAPYSLSVNKSYRLIVSFQCFVCEDEIELL